MSHARSTANASITMQHRSTIYDERIIVDDETTNYCFCYAVNIAYRFRRLLGTLQCSLRRDLLGNLTILYLESPNRSASFRGC